MDAYFAKAGKPVRTNPLNLYTEALKASQGQSTMQTPYADAAAQAKQSGTQNLYAQAAENAKKSGNAAKGTSVVFNSVYGKADDRASSAGSGKYADILKASDYTELSKSGESKRKLFGDARYDYINNIGNFRAQSDVQQAQGRGQEYGKYAFMTDDEIGVYNYLYATKGKKAANAFLSDLEPGLDKQWYTGTNRATTEALGKNAATRTLASAMTVAAQPARTITSMIAMADDAVRTAKGQEINPYSKWRQASNITQDLRADTSQHIEETNPGMGGKVGSFVYNTAMSAADSAMNALVAKGIGEAVGLTGDTLMKATNILGSALMSSEAASLSIAESKEKGYSNAGALALGLTRGAIEYASEAVGGEWVIRKIKANPLSFVKSMALTMIPEGMEEVMSDAANGVVNLAIDAAFGTEESGIPKMLEYYRTSGTDWQKKHAELATVLAVLGQEGLSFLGGALATLGSSSVQYTTNRANINQTAERLDTTPKNVVQMMQDAQTENPGVIYALAELTDAENADDLRRKIGTKEDMKRAAEYLTQQMGASGRSGAQEGTYIAGTQNAPVGAQRAQNEVTIPQSAAPTAPFAQGSRNMKGEFGNEQSAYQGRENGSYDLRTGGQAAAEGGAQALAGGRAEIPGGVGADAQADLRKVTPAQLGIRNGGTEAVTVVDAQKLGGDAARAYNLLAANNIEPVAVRGAIQVNNGYANAYTESGKVFFRVDAVDSRGNAISPEALVRHELFHNYISEEVLQASDEVIRESMTAEEYDTMYESYRDAYASIYDFENMSEDEIERLLTEEIAADAYAGLNWFSGDAPVQEAVRAETERSAPARRAEAQQETTGPPEGRGTIVVLPDGKKYVQADRQVIFGDDPDSWADQIEGYINRKIRNGEDVILTTDSGDVLKITKDTAGKASFRNYVTDENGNRRLMTDSEYEAKLNAEAHIDELVQVSEKKNNIPVPDELGTNGKPLHGGLAKNGWFYRKAWFQDFDGKYYLVTISTADGDNGVVVYNVGDMKRRGSPANIHGSSDSVTETGAQQGKSSSTVTIRQTEGNSQEKSSGKASVAGIGARTADSAALRRAEALEKSGTDNETIRQETGWYRGMDGQWRFEIDDSGAAFSRSGEAQYSADNTDYARYTQLMNRMLTGDLTEAEHAELLGLDKKNGSTKKELARRIDEGNATLRDILQHNALFEAYPEIAETKVKFADMPSGTAGSYNRETNTITLDTKLKYDANDALDALMHEVQHRVQAAEGFASGTNPGYWNRGENYDRAAEKYRDNRARLLNGLSTEDLALYNEYRSAEREMGAMLDGSMLYDESRMDALEKRSDELYRELYGKEWFGKLNRYDRILGDAGEAVKEFYRSTAGEIEARDTAARRRMSAEERKNTPPELGDADTVFADGNTMAAYAEANGNIRRNNIEYADNAARNAAQKALHDRMVSEGKTLDLTENREAASQYFPNLRSMPKAERTAILRERIQTLKNDLRTYLNQLKGVNFEFEINGNTIEATVYNAGVKEVLQNLTQDKAGMLSASEEIFRNAEYLYSTQDKTGSPNVTGWDYFYVPVKIGGDTVGVRIAIRNMAFPTESQIYNWGIKREDTSLDGVGLMPGGRTSADVSSDVSSTATIRQTEGNSQEKSSGKASVEVNPDDTATQRLKEQQFELIQKYHPKADWDYQTWINSVDDVKTYQEAVDDDRAGTPDFDDADIDRALKTGRVRVYSSHRIRIGTFVTPSRMEAENYAGSENVYSKTVPLTDVAWIDSLQGQFAPTSDGRASVEVSGINNRTAAELRREYERRMQENQKATQRDDQNFPYIDEMKWMQAAERRLAELGDGKRKRRTVGNTKRDIMRLFFTDTANRADVEQMLNRNIGEMMAQGEIQEDALDTIVDEMLQAGSVVSNSENSPWIDETHEDIRSDLRGTKLYVSEQTWRDFRKDEARTLREQAREAGITLSKNQNDTPPDVRNIELAEKYGEALFPTDISAPDMLRNIVDRAAKGVSEKQTLADRLWDEARLEGAGRDQQEAYDRMVGALRDQTEVILREFAEDNHLTLREQTKQGSGNETGTKSETEQRRERLQALAEQDRREAERLRARENLGAGQRFVPNKSSGEVYRDLMGKGKSEVKVQMTGFLKGTPKESTFKVEVKPTPIGGYYEATIFHDGHKADTLVRALKETAARDAAEEVITMANRNFSEENYQRAKKFEAEKTADEDARIAELFGDPEQLDSTETSPKSSDAAETENTAAGATIDATTEKVTSEVIKAERNYREDFEKITSGAMRMFVNAGDTVRRIAKATGSKSLEGYYFNAGAYSQRAGNWIAKGGARTDIDGHRIGASLADTLAPMRKNETKYRDFQLYLLHMHNVDRMKYDNSGELERIKENLRWVKEKYPELRELSNEELRRIANSDSDSPVVRQAAHEIYLAAHNGEAPSLTSVAEGAAYALELERQRAIVEKQGLKPVFGYDVTADDSQTAAQLLEAKNPEFKEWAKEVYRYSDDLIRYRVEAGLITPEFANALKKRYPHYIPTFREEGTNSKRARRARRNGGIVVSNAIGRAVGSDGVLLPLHTALSRKTVSTMRNAGLNQFGLALVREYDRNTKAAEKYIWNVAESEYTPTEAAIESDEDYKPVFENVFSVKEKGKVYDITMDEGLAQALNAFQPDKYANSDIAKLLKKGNDLFKALCTGYNPIFMVRNLVRDAQDAAFYSTDSATWAKMFPSAWKQIVTNGEIWQQYKALGGSYASMLDYTTGMVKEPKSAAGKLAAKYESLGQAIEAAPRLAEFMTILANKGGSKTADGVKTGKFTQSDLMEAMLGAADITTNFARGGTVTKMLNKYLVPFLNPSVQGADKFVRNITDRKGFKAWASLAIKAAALGILPELLNGLLYRDDDEWDDIPDQTKSNYYLFKLGDGYWMKIPRGRALAVFSAGATYAQEKAKGNEPKFSDVIEVVKSNVAPTDIFNQNIATAWTQTKLFNPDNPGTTWYGGNIESDRLQNYRPGERYDEKTDELSKWIGKTFNLSPKKINYLLDQYSGVVGDLLLPWFTPSATASSPALAPLKQAFMLDSTSTNKTTGEYYDLLDDLKYDANDGDIGAGITRKYVSHAGDEVNDYYQQIRAIQSDENLTKAEKNRLVRALKAQLIERQKEIIAQAEPYREAVSDYLKAHPELSTDNDAAIAEYAELYGITEDQAESRMDAIVYREANREVFGAEYALRTYNADVYDKARAAYAKGVSFETYYDYYFATKEMHADKDENGKSISGSKKAKVVEYINSLDIPPEQKDALYVAAGYTAKSARNQKWNGGSGGSGGRRGRGKRTALKAPTPKAPEIIIPKSGTASSAKAGGTSKTPKVSGNVIADFTKTASGTDIQKAVTQAKRKALKAGNRTVYVEEGSPIDYFLKYGKLPSLK
ncbi:MAG: hypothetical protein KH332_09670 [Firmicutes bacterium]|nr:hypothetical protein [Bacillota bacterium]